MKQHCNFTGGNETYCPLCNFDIKWARSERRSDVQGLFLLLVLALPVFLVVVSLWGDIDSATLLLGTCAFVAMAIGLLAEEWMR